MVGILNRVGMLISTTGTGTVTADTLISNRFNTPAEAGAVNGESYYWLLEQGNDYEIFEGAWTLSGTLISRDTVIESKISGVHGTTKLTLDGSAMLRSVMPKEAVSSGWTLIETIAATSGNNKVFDNIPDSFADLMLVGTGLRPSKSGSTTIHLDISTNNGSSYDIADADVTLGALDFGLSLILSVVVIGYQLRAPILLAPTDFAGAQIRTLPTVVASSINALRIALDQSGGASNFTTGDSGELRLYGR